MFWDIPDYWARLLAGPSGIRIPIGAKIFLFFETPLGPCGSSNFPPNVYRCSFWGKAVVVWSSIWYQSYDWMELYLLPLFALRPGRVKFTSIPYCIHFRRIYSYFSANYIDELYVLMTVHHNSYNRTNSYRQWNAVGSPDDGHRDARNMLRYYWLQINHYLLHLVGFSFTYLYRRMKH